MIRKVDLICSCEVRAFWMIDLRSRRGNIYVISVTRAIRVPMLCIGPVSYISHIWMIEHRHIDTLDTVPNDRSFERVS